MQENFKNYTKKLKSPECENRQKEAIMKACAAVLNKLKKDKSNYIVAMEYGFSTSLLNLLSRGKKDPQITTIFKLSEAMGIKASEFVKEVEENLPENFSLIEN